MVESPDGFIDHEGCDHPDHHDGTDGSDDFRTMVSISEFGVLCLLG